jgi:hypothetical protein
MTRRTKIILALGLAVWNRPTNICLAVPLVLYVFRHHRPAFARFIALAAIPAGLLVAYSWRYWGSPFALGQGHEIGGFSGHVLTGLLGLLVSPNRGLFVFSPIFLFSFAYLLHIPRLLRDDSIYRYLAVSVVLLVLVYSKWSMWWGGHSFGYRLLVETVPPLLLILARAWDGFIARRTLTRLAFAVALLWSVSVHALGASFAPCGFNVEPNDIDQHTARLWDVGDGELARCAARLLATTPLAGAPDATGDR